MRPFPKIVVPLGDIDTKHRNKGFHREKSFTTVDFSFMKLAYEKVSISHSQTKIDQKVKVNPTDMYFLFVLLENITVLILLWQPNF